MIFVAETMSCLLILYKIINFQFAFVESSRNSQNASSDRWNFQEIPFSDFGIPLRLNISFLIL